MSPCRVLALTLPLALCSGAARARDDSPAEPANARGTESAETAPSETFSSSIEVTTTRLEGSVLEAPVAVAVIPAQQIETSPAKNMAELLRGVPGLNVVQLSARDVEVRSRGPVGVAEKSELVLLDGRSVYVDYYGYVAWDTLPVDFDEIERIEVQQGPGSALWGANAMSGVINLITKSPRQMTGGLATLAAGEQGYRAASVRWSAAVGPWSYKLSTSLLEQDAWPRTDTLPSGDAIPAGYSFENAGTDQTKANVRVDYEREAGRLWSARAGVGSTSGIFHSSVGPYLIEEGSNVSYLEGVYTSGTLDGRVFWNRLRADAPALLSGLPARFETDTYVGELTRRFAIGSKQVVVAGGEARLYRFDLSIAPLGDSRNVGGIFAADQIRLRPTLELYLGGRLDAFDTIGTVLSPRLSLVWQPVASQSLRISFNRSYRAPALLDNYLQVTTPGALDLGPQLPPFVFYFDGVGNPDLEEER
ncbi:MAG: TonB-dependent receptor, partial [Thermoanaerobaculia bacterium]|nr:TonB-dependent receptor [Thermoanaerobaculia bacterium]